MVYNVILGVSNGAFFTKTILMIGLSKVEIKMTELNENEIERLN